MATPRRSRYRRAIEHLRQASATTRSTVQRVGFQGFERARQAGRLTARKVIAIQRAARLEPRLMLKSARSVAERHMTRDSDRAWQAGYAAEAAGRLGPPPPGPRPPQPSGPDRDPDPRPSWPQHPAATRGADMEAGR